MLAMKKLLSRILTAGIIASCISLPVFADDGIKVTVDGQRLQFDVEPQIINDRTMVPMRAIFEKLGAEVDYIAEEKAVLSKKDGKILKLVINSNTMTALDAETNSVLNEVALDAPATIIDGRTLVPVRAVAEGLNCEVQWEKDTKTVVITSPSEAPETPAQPETPAKPETPAQPETPAKEEEKTPAEPEIVEFLGMGGKTIENVNIPAGPYYCESYHSGGILSLSVYLYTDGELNQILTNGRSGNYAGQTFLDSFDGISDGSLVVKADGNWRIRFIPVTEKTTTKIKGLGDIVTGYFTAEQDIYNASFKYDGDHNIIIWLYDLNTGRKKLVVNEISDYEVKKELQLVKGHDYAFEVIADVKGYWQIDLGIEGAKETKYSSSTLILKEQMKKD